MEDGTQPPARADLLDQAREVVRQEAAAIAALEARLDERFLAVVDAILACEGRVVVTGVGKAGLIGAKVSATLASTGTYSFFLHPSEALHGDLGRVRQEDLVVLVSNSGESQEVLDLLDPLRRIGATLCAMTGAPDSRLGTVADLLLDCGKPSEACPLGLAPTTSTAALLALGDALAMTLIRARGFGVRDYARYHPGGALGRKLIQVHEVMRDGDRVTRVPLGTTVRDTLIAMNRTRGRPGAVMIEDAQGKLVGFFTDGDLARRLERDHAFLTDPIEDHMVHEPYTIRPDRLASEALHHLREHRIDQIPVVDDEGCPVGLVDVQDLLDARIV